jgi:hypothetical protein
VTVTLDEAVERLDTIRGWLSWNRIYEGGEEVVIVISLVDAEGETLPPEPELITLEADGAWVSETFQANPVAGYNMMARLKTDPGAGPGEVRVRAIDGRLLATYPFQRLERGVMTVDLEQGEASLEQLPLGDEKDDATHRLKMQLLNPFGEPLGAAAKVSLTVLGGTLVSALETGSDASQEAYVAIDPEAPLMSVEVRVNGAWFTTLEATGTGVDPGHDTGAGFGSPDAVDSGGPTPEALAPAPEDRDEGGCSGSSTGSSPLSGPLLLWILAMAGWLRSRAQIPSWRPSARQ